MAMTSTIDRRNFQAGDRVYCVAYDEEWLLALDEERGRVVPAGWPMARVDWQHVTLVEASTEEGRLTMLREVAECSCPYRAPIARRQLESR
jgi:hypothetical protein